MTHQYADILFTDAVKSCQSHYGSRSRNQNLQHSFGPNKQLTATEIEFIAQRDSFYLATVGESGWPYVQHRGGPVGFLTVVGPNRLAYADFKGNTQLISAGNATSNDKCSLILVDYSAQRRLKLLGKIHMLDARGAPVLYQDLVSSSTYRAKVERVAVIDVVAFDWNCPQHIKPRYTLDEIAEFAQAATTQLSE